MSVTRVVTDLQCADLAAAQDFYVDVLGMRPAMEHGWITTLVDPERPEVHLSLATHDETAPVVPAVSIQVDDVEAAYAAAQARGAKIVHPLTVEPWGVRRFFVRDPDGHVINILEHA